MGVTCARTFGAASNIRRSARTARARTDLPSLFAHDRTSTDPWAPVPSRSRTTSVGAYHGPHTTTKKLYRGVWQMVLEAGGHFNRLGHN
jgi:hypothetical protein